MNDLGTIPPVMPDTRAVALLNWSLVTDLNGLGEAVMTFAVRHRSRAAAGTTYHEDVLIVMVNPRTLFVVRAVEMGQGRKPASINVDRLPGMIRDIATTIVAEHRNTLLKAG